MTENPIEHALHAIRTMDHSKEAALQRLLRVGVIAKSGMLSRYYRSVSETIQMFCHL